MAIIILLLYTIIIILIIIIVTEILLTGCRIIMKAAGIIMETGRQTVHQVVLLLQHVRLQRHPTVRQAGGEPLRQHDHPQRRLIVRQPALLQQHDHPHQIILLHHQGVPGVAEVIVVVAAAALVEGEVE